MRKKRGIWTQRCRKEGHVKTEAETEVMLPQAKEYQWHQNLGLARREPPLAPLGDQGSSDNLTLDLRPIELHESKFLL